MQSNMVHQFSQVPRANIPRSSFQRNATWKGTYDADYLIPVLLEDCIPGDTASVRCQFFTRLLSPTVSPLNDNLYMDSFFFFVPYRLVWDNFEKFHGSQVDPGDSIDYTIPALTTGLTLSTSGRLADYFGLPLTVDTTNDTISCLPFRAYRLIYNEWFRAQDLQDSVTMVTDDGPDTNAETGAQSLPLKRNKRFDYFTSALPSPQKGDAVDLPLGTEAPVFGDSAVSAGSKVLVQEHDATGSTGDVWELDVGASAQLEYDATLTTSANLKADLSNATAATINDLRLAFQTQRLVERDARSGTRYPEMILAHYGVTVPDFRVQRPEFLGGGSTPIVLSNIGQTTYQGTQTLQDAKGALASIGVASGEHSFTASFVEHGMLIGLINVRSDITYSQGLDRYWSKSTRYDFYYPVLAQIGEQSILNQEIYHQSSPGTGASQDQGTFGYIPRYDEYRYKNSLLTGLMRVDAASNLDEYHLSEDFASLPTLGDSFIQSNTASPLDRAIAVPSQPQFLTDIFFKMRRARS